MKQLVSPKKTKSLAQMFQKYQFEHFYAIIYLFLFYPIVLKAANVIEIEFSYHEANYRMQRLVSQKEITKVEDFGKKIEKNLVKKIFLFLAQI